MDAVIANDDPLAEKRRKLRDAMAADARTPMGAGERIPRRSGDTPPPLSSAQERLWFLNQYYPDSPIYNMSIQIGLPGPVSVAAVQAALDALAERHESLRTRFATVHYQPVQEIAAPAPVPLHLEAIDPTDPAAAQAALTAILARENRHLFDLAAGPLFRAVLVRFGAQGGYLVVTMHHIISDGWSMAILQREFTALYAAFDAGQASPLPPLGLQYGDFALWQRQSLQRDGMAAQMAFWRERLGDVAGQVLDLPVSRARPPALSFRGATINFLLPAGLSARLMALGQSLGATPFMTLLAAFNALLHRYSGAPTLVVGFPTAGRNRTELEPLIGFFVNSLPLRTDIDPGMSFRDLVLRVKDGALAVLAHQDVPLEHMVDALQVPRMLHANPLFQVMFDLHTQPAAAVSTPAEAAADLLEILPVSGNGTAKFDLSLSMLNDGTRISGGLEYSTDLFDERTIRRLIGHFHTLLEAAVAAPDMPVGRLPLLTALEQQAAAVHGPRDPEPDAPHCLHRLFERQAARTPDAIAVSAGDTRLSYAALDAQAEHCARQLRAAGIGPEQRVGVCIDAVPERVVAVLAVLKAGAAYLPLDPAYPPARLALMASDAGAVRILADARGEALLGDTGIPCSSVAALLAEPASDAGGGADDLPGAAAYVIYTSGSTGRPKGVVVPHEAVSNLVRAFARRFGTGPGSRVLAFNAFSFDISVTEMFVPLVSGGTLCLRPRAALEPGEPLLRTLREEAITTVTLPPLVWAQLPETPLPALRCAVTGGAACPAAAVTRWAPGRLFYNAYGPTEVTIASSAALCVPDGEKPTIGTPLEGLTHHVLDTRMEPVPIGVPGELWVGGAGVARGYLGQPGLTAERFVPDPFGATPGARLYRTGDLVRRLEDGSIDFLGRVDDQVEIRGFRIEPGEIEAALQAVPGVAAAAAICHSDGAGNKRIVGYIVPRPGAEVTPDSARAHLAARLPDYLVPASILAVDHMPLTSGGKVDRDALPSPESVRAATVHVPPRSPLERLIAQTWADLLGCGPLGADENFFEVGGHSLMATQVVSRLRDALDVEIPVRAVFEAPTSARLAAVLRDGSDDADSIERRAEQADGGTIAPARPVPAAAAPPPVPPRIPRRPEGAPAPLSFAQERLWFLDRYSPGSPAYNTLAPLPLPEPVDLAAVQRALDAMAARHECLRTRFEQIDDVPMQVVDPVASVPLAVEDCREAGVAAAQAAIARAALAPFDLARGPLLRVLLVRSEGPYAILLIMMHHIISDDWSRRVFFDDFLKFYTGFAGGQPVTLAPLPIQYADFALWQRATLQGEKLQAKLDYWTQELAGAPAVLDLPTDRPRPQSEFLHSAMRPVAFPPELAAGLGRLARSEGATMFMTVLAAFYVLLHRYTGHRRIPVGTPITNRDRTELEGLIGLLTNTLVLCGDLSGTPSFRTLLRRVRETSMAAFSNQDLPFERLVEAINPPRNHQVNPLFQVMFVLQKATGTFSVPAEPPEGSAAQEQPLGVAKFDLMLYLEEGEQGLFGGIEYAVELFDRATIDRMGAHLGALLAAIVADPDAPIDTLSLVSPEEARLLRTDWALGPLAAGGVPPRGRDVLQRFSAQAARTPNAPALRGNDWEMSYAALDEAANHLAHRLIAEGVSPDAPVAVILHRGPLLMMTLLAVLKAGGAFCMVDPTLPPDRLAYILQDAAPAVLLTEPARADSLPPVGMPCLVLDAGRPGANLGALADRRSDPPAISVAPEQSAYIVYTSGSTGTPKGVVVTHRTLTDLIGWQCSASRLPAGSRTLQFAAPGFDVFVQEALATWCAGGTLVCASDYDRRDPHALLRLLERQGIHRLFLPYVALQQIAEARFRDPEAASGLVLEEVVTAGEQLIATPEIAALFESQEAALLINQYGPSETHVVSQHVLGPPADGWPTLPPIGRPSAGARLYILDAEGRMVPPGVVGELCIGGSAVARGYLGRPGATAERFQPDPFADTPGARLYRSGDLARHLPDGTIAFLGRRDHQVKIQGFRVEPGEVEAVLLRQPGVTEAAVVVERGGAGSAQHRLIAHVVAAPYDAAALRQSLQQTLPDYMVPARIYCHAALPRTATGKLDRLRLPVADAARPELGTAYVAPVGEVEGQLAAIWAELLGVESPGAQDSFFDLGGHSLLGARLVSRIQAVFAVELPLRTVFEAPTIAALAAEIVRVKLAEQCDDPALAQLLAELEGEGVDG